MERPVLLGYKVLASELIKVPGSLSDANSRVVLSPLDHVLTNATFYSALFYHQTLDESLLRQALEATLACFHPLSGRLELVKVRHIHDQPACDAHTALYGSGSIVWWNCKRMSLFSNHGNERRTTTLRLLATTEGRVSPQQYATTPYQTLCHPQEPASSSPCSCFPSQAACRRTQQSTPAQACPC